MQASTSSARASEPQRRSFLPAILAGQTLQRDFLYWELHEGQFIQAVRVGDWKLIEFYEDMNCELYNLKDDLGETRDLAPGKPEKAAELRAKLHQWRASVGAQMPTPNPNYTPLAPGKKSTRTADAELRVMATES